MPDCYNGDRLLRTNYTSNICNCENFICKQRIGLNTSHISEEEKKQLRGANPFSFRLEPCSAEITEQKREEQYDPMEYIWKRRKKWAVKFQCNTDGSTICFGYVCPQCKAESAEPLDECPQCGADMRKDWEEGGRNGGPHFSFAPAVGVGDCDPVGAKGRPGVCPKCGGTDITWEPSSDVSRCNTCGWSDSGEVCEDMNCFLLRYYDYDQEDGNTVGIYSAWDKLLADIVDKYEGRVDISRVKPPKHGYTQLVEVDNGDYGACLRISEHTIW